MTSIETVVNKARVLTRSGDDAGAMRLVCELLDKFPEEKSPLAFRAHLHSMNGAYQQSWLDLSRAMLVDPLDPCLFYLRGDCSLQLGQAEAALADFDDGLALCDQKGDNYCRDTLIFLRAEALISLGRTIDAARSLQQLPDDFSFWTPKLRTKADLLRDCCGDGGHG